jgi:uncharacterized protein YndB with AHSA1/START domain
MSMATGPTITVTRHIQAPPERVFDAWLDPQMIRRWMFGVLIREEILRVDVDARVGGSFSFLVRRDGQELDHVGKYFEIDRPQRLVFSWSIGKPDPGSRVAVEIAPAQDGCDLSLTHEIPAAWADHAARTEEGWRKMTGVLAGIVEGEK